MSVSTWISPHFPKDSDNIVATVNKNCWAGSNKGVKWPENGAAIQTVVCCFLFRMFGNWFRAIHCTRFLFEETCFGQCMGTNTAGPSANLMSLWMLIRAGFILTDEPSRARIIRFLSLCSCSADRFIINRNKVFSSGPVWLGAFFSFLNVPKKFS